MTLRHFETHSNYCFHQSSTRVLMWLYRVYLLIVSINISTMQQPFIILLNSNTTMTASVSNKRNQDKVCLCYSDWWQTVVSEPLITFELVDLPLGIVRPVFRLVSSPLHQSPRMKPGIEFSVKDVNSRSRKIR